MGPLVFPPVPCFLSNATAAHVCPRSTPVRAGYLSFFYGFPLPQRAAPLAGRASPILRCALSSQAFLLPEIVVIAYLFLHRSRFLPSSRRVSGLYSRDYNEENFGWRFTKCFEEREVSHAGDGPAPSACPDSVFLKTVHRLFL